MLWRGSSSAASLGVVHSMDLPNRLAMHSRDLAQTSSAAGASLEDLVLALDVATSAEWPTNSAECLECTAPSVLLQAMRRCWPRMCTHWASKTWTPWKARAATCSNSSWMPWPAPPSCPRRRSHRRSGAPCGTFGRVPYTMMGLCWWRAAKWGLEEWQRTSWAGSRSRREARICMWPFSSGPSIRRPTKRVSTMGLARATKRWWGPLVRAYNMSGTSFNEKVWSTWES